MDLCKDATVSGSGGYYCSESLPWEIASSIVRCCCTDTQ
jgi:hypothetical protein